MKAEQVKKLSGHILTGTIVISLIAVLLIGVCAAILAAGRLDSTDNISIA